jgi:hypothetical protein
MTTFVRCSIQGCRKNAHRSAHGAKGMCSAHYQRSRIHGDPLTYKKGPLELPFKECSVEGCDRDARRSANGKNGLCSMHYQRAKKPGGVTVKGRRPSPAWDWLVAHVDHADETECLPWPFGLGDDGYGRARDPETGKQHTASRIMCALAHGPAPSRRHEAAHTCGKGADACINPNHLYWATPKENHADKVLHGTSNRGERQWSAKLNRDDVLAIRRMAVSDTQAEVAKAFGVTPSHVNRIVHRSVWRWLD